MYHMSPALQTVADMVAVSVAALVAATKMVMVVGSEVITTATVATAAATEVAMAATVAMVGTVVTVEMATGPGLVGQRPLPGLPILFIRGHL